jgi:threonine/homoserine/homoserine lactone efflux protein
MTPGVRLRHVKTPEEFEAGDRLSAVLPTNHLVAFLVTVYVLILIPGPSVLFVISRGVALGRRAALATVVGNTTGLLFQLVLVVVGLGSVLAGSETVYTAIKLVGGAYLVILGVRSIRHRKTLAVALAPTAVAPRRLGTIVREGFLVGATNPKGLLIFTAVLPAFIDRSRGHETLQLTSLGLVCAVIALLSDGTWAIASGTARTWLGRSPRRLERMSAGGGVTMIALGVGLALTGRRR